MNKNQKRVRLFSRKNRGQAWNVHRQYDTTCKDGKPTESSLVRRIIPVEEQPRKSKQPKVAAE